MSYERLHTFTLPLLLISVLSASILVGCGKETDDPVQNQEPLVRITGGPPEREGEILEDTYTAQIWWTGWDFDGVIERYEYCLDPNPDPENPAFTFEEIGSPEEFLAPDGDLSRTIIPGPEDNTDTLRYCKEVEGEVACFEWVQTTEFTRTFDFKTPNADSTASGGVPRPQDRYSGLHTVFVRAFDNEGAYSTLDDLTYTAVTITPEAWVTRPAVNPGGLFVGTQIRVTWDGRDLDSPEPDKKPVAYMYKLVNLGEVSPQIPFLQANPDFVMYRHQEASALPWVIQDADTTEVSFFLNQASYMFAVRAIDVAGAVQPFVGYRLPSGETGNAFKFQVQKGAGNPVMSISEPSLGAESGFRGLGTVEWEVPVGAPLRFNWSATAESYGGLIEGYNWGVNIPEVEKDGPGSGWTGWSTGTTNLTPISFDKPGINVVYVKARDTGGGVTLIAIVLRVVEFPFDRELLLVDDYKDGTWPRDFEHDDFWTGMAENSGRLTEEDLQPEVLNYSSFGDRDVFFVFPDTPDLELLGRYRMIFWNCLGSGFDGATALVESGPIRRHLGAYLRAGGKLWVSGGSTIAAMMPSLNGRADFVYPKDFSSNDFPWQWFKLYTSNLRNDKNADNDRNALIAVEPFPDKDVVWPGMEVDEEKLNLALRDRFGVGNIDVVFDPIFGATDPKFVGTLDSLYVMRAVGPVKNNRSSPYDRRLVGLRYHDNVSVDSEGEPRPTHGPTVWFGFPMYYFEDDQAQVVFNGILDWFRSLPGPRI